MNSLNQQTIDKIKNLPKPTLVGISGFGGSGKSTTAKELGNKLDAPVVGVDSFQKKGVFDTNFNLWEIMNFARLEKEVLKPFQDQDNVIRYGHADAKTGLISETVELQNNGILIVEGVGLFRPELMKYFTYKIWIDCPIEKAISRGKKRDREEYHNPTDELWDGVWRENDLEYYSAFKPAETADLIIQNQEPNYTEFSDPRLVALYDVLNAFGEDSEFFCKQAKELKAKTIIDLGCGTGLLTCELAKRGHQMIGIEPSVAMLDVARSKPFADKIQWIKGSFEQMNGLQADMILMTSHVAQFFLKNEEWTSMLKAAYKILNSGGHLVFDIRRLTNPPFVGWPTETNRRKFENTDAGPVEWWFKLISNENQKVRYELHYFFKRTGEEVVSVNELMFRSQEEITRALTDEGFQIEAIYGNWDGSSATPTSPEMIFIARRT